MKMPTKKQFTNWASRISRSDQRAFDELFRSFYPVLVRFGSRYVQDTALSKDIAQECFAKLWQRRDQIDTSKSLKSYLYTMMRNRSLNSVRDDSELFVDHEMAVHRQENSEETDLVPDSESDAKPLKKKFNGWINELPERQKEAFQLSRFEGLDHDEISDVMGISPKTVNNHIVSALQFLRSRYEDDLYEEKKRSNDRS